MAPDKRTRRRRLRRALGRNPIPATTKRRISDALDELAAIELAALEAYDEGDDETAERLDAEYAEKLERLEAYAAEALEGWTGEDLEPEELDLLTFGPRPAVTPGPVGGAVAEDLTAALADIYREYIAGHDRFDPSYYDRPVRGFEISTRRDVLAVIARSVIEDHFQKALPHVPAAEIVEAVVDAYERRQDLIGRYRALKTNPAIDPRIAEVFEEMTAKLGRRFSDLGPVELVADERAAKGGERQYAYCKSGPEGTEIAFASRAADLPLSNLRGLMAHELGHALDFRYSEEELRRRLGPLELDAGAERRADQLAEAALGTRILYDRRDVQCVGCRTGTSPRPAHLAKNTYRP